MEWKQIEVMFTNWMRVVVCAPHEAAAEILAKADYIREYEKMPPPVLSFKRIRED